MLDKLNNVISKNIVKIFIIFLFIQPFLDALIGILNDYSIINYINYFIKFSFMFLVLYYLIVILKKNRVYIFVLFIYSIIYLIINAFASNDISVIIYETTKIIKCIYFVTMIFFSLQVVKENDFKLEYLVICFISYLLLIFIPDIFNMGFDSYNSVKEGKVGFFISANVIGNILSILSPIFILFIINKKKILLYPLLIIYFYVLLNLGTKGPLLCLVILFIYYFLFMIVKLIKNKKYRLLSCIIVVLLLLILLIVKLLPSTPFYKNLLIHLEFLNIHSIKDLFTLENIDHFIFGSRFKLLKETFNQYNLKSLIHKLFGIGYLINGNEIKTCEMDYFVILIHQGIFGFVIIFAAYIKNIFNIVKNYIKNFKDNFMNINSTSIFISLIISILCAFFIGHAIDVPSVSIFIGIIIGLCKKNLKI